GVGLLRTLPPPDPRMVAELESAARALGVRWSDGAGYADAVRGLRGDDPEEAALLNVAARALRGAGYLALVPGTPPPERPEQLQHSAVASVYAHVTAPLRRLCDRHATEVCLALHAGQDPPAGIVAAL